MRRLLLLLAALLVVATARAQDEGGYSEPQGPGYGTVSFYNQTVFEIDFYVDGSYACRAWAGGSCSSQVSPGTHYLSGRTVEATPRETNETVQVADGGSSDFTVSGGGSAPTGYGAIEVRNGSAFPLEIYVDGIYACRAEASSSCTAQASVGTHYVTARTVEATPRESSAGSVEVVEGGTSSLEFSGGGDAPTGYGAIDFINATAFSVDFYIDGAYACRAASQTTCSAQATAGRRQITSRTVEDNPRESPAMEIDVPDSGTARIEFTGGGEPIVAPPPRETNAGAATGSIMFDNRTDALLDFYIDGAYACRAPAFETCSARAAPGLRNIAGRTLETPAREVTGTADVPAGGTTAFTVTGGGAPPPPPAQTGRSGSIVFDNRTDAVLDFHIDGAYACRAAAHGTCAAPAAPGLRAITGRTAETPPREVTGTVEVPPNATTTFKVTSGKEAAPGTPAPQ